MPRHQPRTLSVLSALAVLMAAPASPRAADLIPVGKAKLRVEVRGTALDVFTYKPAGTADGPLILVFHGTLRNAEAYRDHSIGMADRFGAVVAAPRFDEQRFPLPQYQLGGLLTKQKTLAPRADWTWSLVPELAAELRRREGKPQWPYYLIGHSAGGQFLARMSGFVSTGAERIVAANPGTHLFPTRTAAYPFGFGGLPDEVGDDAAVRRYLAQPLTIYLGTGDVIQDENFPNSEDAEKRQGDSRYARGKNVFAAAKTLAADRGWAFRWRLVEAAGVAHDHEKMFDHPACKDALFGPAAK